MELILADVILLTHFLFILFVIFGQIGIIAGAIRHWVWVRSPAFRVFHLAAIGIVVLQSWIGVACPLTILENKLRMDSGVQPYAGSFFSYWLGRLVYCEAPDWMFTIVYSVFGAIVAVSWLFVKPDNSKRKTLQLPD